MAILLCLTTQPTTKRGFMNSLKRGKECIGQKVVNKNGDVAIIKNMFTRKGKKSLVVLLFNNGEEITREKYQAEKGCFRKPIKFDLEKHIKNGFSFIPGFDNKYIINKNGVVKPVSGQYKGKTIKHYKSYRYSGFNDRKSKSIFYVTVSLQGKKRKGPFNVHRLIAQTFIGEIKDGCEVNHINGNTADNRLENLEIVSRHENNKKYFNFNKYLSQHELKIFEEYCIKNNINFSTGIKHALKAFVNSKGGDVK
jgi:hypothetical protein